MTERESVNILRVKEISTSPWIQLKRVVYETDGGEALEWDYIERTNDRTSVLILPRFKESGDILFVRQYRVILDRNVIGFPAGVLGDEDVETCALRELREETGYSGQIVEVSPPLTLNSALVRETARCVGWRWKKMPARWSRNWSLRKKSRSIGWERPTWKRFSSRPLQEAIL